jgi:hypothetical protein
MKVSINFILYYIILYFILYYIDFQVNFQRNLRSLDMLLRFTKIKNLCTFLLNTSLILTSINNISNDLYMIRAILCFLDLSICCLRGLFCRSKIVSDTICCLFVFYSCVIILNVYICIDYCIQFN